MEPLKGTLLPFLYPSFNLSRTLSFIRLKSPKLRHISCRRSHSLTPSTSPISQPLNPPPSTDGTTRDSSPTDDYSRSLFADRCRLVVHTGSGGHGCASFLREKYVPEGPANGGDGGVGGSIFIQAIPEETSLYKLSRRRNIRAGRGKNGKGKSQGGERGGDIVITVPVGTVVREVERFDPVAEEEEQQKLARRAKKSSKSEGAETEGSARGSWRRDKWLIYPGTLPSSFGASDFPSLPRPRRSNLVMLQPAAPIHLDLSKPMSQPLLLAAGAMGGFGNPHFVTKSIGRPKYATKGDIGMSLTLDLELKLLADVGLVGLPNAGKSTLLRAISHSRARVGSWAFTTLTPNIGTVVLDNYHGRPRIQLPGSASEELRSRITIADIPGLVEDAHLDRGLGFSFLRHVERARVLAFVVDLSHDPVETLKSLWKEVGEFEAFRSQEVNEQTERRIENGDAPSSARMALDDEGNESMIINPSGSTSQEGPLTLSPFAPISSKPWFVVATKADLPETQENFVELQAYVNGVSEGSMEHPSGRKNAWKSVLKGRVIPVSAINGMGVGGVSRVIDSIVELLNA